MRSLPRPIFFLFACLLAAAAFAQSLEVIGLRHRTAEEIVPQVRPFLEPGGTLTGMQDKLFLRASSRNAEDIRRLVAELDVPQRRLMISLRQETEEEAAARGGAVAGGVAIGRDRDDGRPKVSLGGTARIYSSERAGHDRVLQSVQTIDGGRASIVVGQSVLLPMRQVVLAPGGVIVGQSFVQRDLGTGFVAVPRVSGERVLVEISPMHDTPGPVPNSANVQRLSTTISGALGEWLVLGGASAEGDRNESGTRWGTRTSSERRRMLLKVDELR